jgi:hypothetical protein
MADALWVPPGSNEPPKLKAPLASQKSADDSKIIQPYDSEFPFLEKAARKIADFLARGPSQGDATRAIIESYAEEGFVVEVIWKMPVDHLGRSIGRRITPEVSLVGRVERPEETFDHDRQKWEVQHDVLGIDPNPGVMMRDGTIKSPPKVTSLGTK